MALVEIKFKNEKMDFFSTSRNSINMLWYSKNINAKGDYFAMNSKNMKINDFNLIEEYVR